MTELWSLGAGELARRIAAREVTSEAVIEAHLDRIAAVNPRLNAIVSVLETEARAGARAADAAVRAGERLGPLHGVPFTVKENIDVAGLPTTQGVVPLAGAIAARDAPVVERMRAAGGIPIGRTNLPDMGLRVHTDSSLRGLTRNPWSERRTAGGSSGGEGSALAAGLSPIGLGNDIGGSLRNPANACGIASIRPSAQRVPYASDGPSPDRPLASQFMAVEGPMARRIADVRLGLSVLSGAHPRDPWTIDPPVRAKPDRPPRVAVVPAPPGGSTDPGVAAVVRRAADALSDAGYDVSERTPPEYEAALEVWERLIVTDLGATLPEMEALMGPDARAFLAVAFSRPPRIETLRDFSLLLARREGVARAWSEFMDGFPLVLTPTWTQPPFDHGFDIESVEATHAVLEMMRPVMPANLLGLPSACASAGLHPVDGLPVGILVNGRRMRDEECLDAAEVIEARLAVETPVDPAW